MQSKIRNKNFNREVDMYKPLLQLFKNIDITAAEVPFFGKHIDLLFASRTFRTLYAVEMKLFKWRNAFKQAALNQVAVQRSYIAVPKSLAMRLYDCERELFLKYNIGIIAVNKTASIILPSVRNKCFSLRHYRLLKNTLIKVKSKKPKKIGVIANAISKRSQTLVVLQTRAS